MVRKFCDVERAIEELAAGKVLIVADSEERKNEGDFLVAAQGIKAETIHFMTKVGRGQLCVPVGPEIVEQLQLTPMVANAAASVLPKFMIPIDHLTCGTGISPQERATTIRAMLDEASRPEDFVRPGHIFPLAACPGGLLQRTGHTEASVDLARFAGLAPAGVLCEICSRNGRTMALRDELFEIAERFDLPLVTIDAILDFRRRESRVEADIFDDLTEMQREVDVVRVPKLSQEPVAVR